MKNSPSEVVGSCAQRESEEDSAKLKLHSNETNNSLHQQLEKQKVKKVV